MTTHTDDPDDTEDDDEVEPIPLSALSGARLTWENADGTTDYVEFDE
jgi:hypothetical protein